MRNSNYELAGFLGLLSTYNVSNMLKDFGWSDLAVTFKQFPCLNREGFSFLP